MTAFLLEVAVFGALLGLPFLYEARPAFRYSIKFLVYNAVVMVISLFLIPVFSVRPGNVLNLVLASYCCRWITNLIGIRWELRNGERLEPQQPCIIVSNHQSSLDILGMFQIWSTMGRCTVIARKEVFWVWPFGVAAWLAGLVFIPRVKTDKAKVVMNEAVERVKHNQTKLWVFPEGTRRNTGEIHPFKKGAFHAAISGQLPILPVVFSRYYFLDSKNKRFDQGVVVIQVLEPIETKGVSIHDVDILSESIRGKMSKAFHKASREALSCTDDSPKGPGIGWFGGNNGFIRRCLTQIMSNEPAAKYLFYGGRDKT